ncbi:DNA-directed RNA polymerase subunit D [Methanoplanus sp. FWC-SCC4]|uniref:DNA-directed RNA polymerase subunit Rpo3 n=1 Tax=Methanochimaera problematica TaxID=2609417 RepID=A0AA97FDG5_9EURY|nr:DNA-directed RNA polymerase subunit D [Methanoplanus sp. FWC-SCC4]WOF16517.1 DNA-directed RNA polymerase subunit D [Methanoplanus sp. FWC-SCC4]
MEIAFSRLDDGVAKFVLSGVSPAFANSLRRTMIGEVPTLAIEDVIIYDNSSALFDEILTHRLGLIPLKTNLSEYKMKSECSCNGEGCPVCESVYTLSVEGPGLVTTSDLIPQNPETAPVNPDIPVVKLEVGQKVVLEAHAELNIGLEHAKWQPTLACGYKTYPVITVSDKCDSCGACVDECPRSVLKLGKKSVEIIESNLENCSMCKLCEKACMASGIGDEPAIRISSDDSKFIFVVESDGSMPVKDIMICALNKLKNKSESLVNVLTDISGAI